MREIPPGLGWAAVVPVGITWVVTAVMTGGFQSPADVYGDRDGAIAAANNGYADAARIRDGGLVQAERTFRDELPTALQWDARWLGVPLSGWVFIGGVVLILTSALLFWLASEFQNGQYARAQGRRLKADRAHELAMAKEKTEQDRLKYEAELLARPLPKPSKETPTEG